MATKMYFKDFPNIFYTYNINNQNVLKVVKDVTVNVRLRKQILESISLYDEYDIQEGETPDILAARYYGDSQYHWVIMLTNEKYDYLNDWPMPSAVLNDYIREKYNKYKITSWTYTTDVNYTYIVAQCPDHGISTDEVTANMSNPVTLEDVYVTSSSITGDTTVCVASGIASSGTITSVTANTITIRVKGNITGTVPETWPSGSYSWSPSGDFSLTTTNREYLVKHYELNGYIVDDGTVGSNQVTYFDYETALNDSKRRIKLISPNLINDILNSLEDLVK